jgi:hypothetical protein
MGYSLAWLAIKGKEPRAVLETLGFASSGTFEPIPESDLVAATLPTGWYLIITDDEQVAPDSTLQQLTVNCEAVTCFVEEHVMVSTASGWRDGRCIWTITHESERGIEHLETSGELPSEFPAIRDRLQANQQAEDTTSPACDYIFDIPVTVAESLTGYRHDGEIPEIGDRGFEVLTYVPSPGPKKSWLGRLFNKIDGD